MSEYCFGILIFICGWLVLFFARPASRRLQLQGSCWLLPFALLDIWFRPDYWHPPLLIKAIEPLSLETTVYCFTAGGIAIVFGGLFFKPARKFQVHTIRVILFITISLALFGILQALHYSSAMNNLNFPFLAIWIFLLVRDFKQNIKSMIPALLFAVFTIAAIRAGSIFYPGFVQQYWNLPKLWPLFLGAPAEEIVFAFSLGALWSLLPRYLLTGAELSRRQA
jgi:hypothetical protein